MNNKELGLKLKIDGDISDILQSLKDLKQAFATVEMPDKLTKNLEKSLDSAIQKVGEFGKKGEAAINSISDSKEISKAWKTISKELTALQVKLEGINVQDLFPKEVIANLEKAEEVAKKYNEALTGAKTSNEYKSKLEELNKIAELQKATESNSKKANQEALKAEATYNKEKAQWTEETNQKYEQQQQKIKDTTNAFEEQQKKVKELIELQKQLQSEGYLTSNKTVPLKKKEVVDQLADAEAEEKTLKNQVTSAKGQVTRYKNANSGKELSKDKNYLDLVKKQTEAEEKHAQALQRVKQLREQSVKVALAQNIGKQVSEARELENSLKGQAEVAKEAGSALATQKRELDNAKQAYIDASADVETYKNNLEKLGQQQDNINNELKNIQTKKAEEEWKDLVEVIKEFTGVDLTESAHDIEAVNAAVAKYKEDELKNLPQILKQICSNATPIAPAMERVGESIKETGEDAERLTQTANEIQNLKNQVLDFFSLTNSVQLFKRAVTSALNTVKELDATMTEAAVVTEFDVGDMWGKLPQYSKNAQELGVSINGMYQATTLYYQQGLKSQEAMELGIETMKMGKIAAMDSTEATKAMTAALRGFNMELNETSATRVNDVYSQLAAVTAADTNQIATAMEKTASIAASANMEFESTAAFLAQIIETTQEAPETAGTALKTIIARFAEVKSLREQGLTSGEDSEGEVIDVNKIQKALRTVGISMEGFFAGTEGLDSILLKLAEKWGTLDFETQRYIATTAAGSRQQSRFIAMMSDYGRTTELVGEAQNSAGASQKQFEKTQESLATSLTRLKNAWDQFLMGLANNEILKAGVDGLTKILETINKITDGISGGNGLVKSVVSLAGVLATLKGGKALLGGTVVGGAMSGLVGKFTGTTKGEDGSTIRKPGYFSLPEGIDPGTGWSKEEWKRGTEAKRAQRAANKKSIKEQLKNKFTNTTTTKTQTVSKNLGQIELGLSEDDLSARAMGIRKLNEELAEGLITEEQAAEGYVKLGGSLEDLDTVTTKTSLNFNAIGQAANTAGMAMMAAGAATSLLASAFESWGMEKEAEAMQTLSGVLMAVGPILMGIGSFLPVLTSLTAAQAAATWAALWPILLIVAALGALVAVIVLVAKHQHDISLEGRMEAAAEATERAKEAAEGANQAYEDLLSAKSGYDELQNQLDTLTKGTLEWKQALADSNAQVLELLSTYPVLAQYLTRGEHGELEIIDEGWDKVIEQQAQAVKNANANVVASQMEETRLQQEKIEQKLYTSGIEYKKGNQWITGEQAAIDVYNKYKEIGADKLFALDSNGGYSQALYDLADELEIGEDKLYKMKDALAEYDKELANNESIMQAQSEALLSSQVSDETMDYKYSKELIAGMAAGISKNQGAREKEIAEKVNTAGKRNENRENEYFKQLAKENGLTEKDFTGRDKDDLEILYAKMAGIKREEIAEGLKGDRAALAEEIAKIQAAKDAGAETDKVYQAMSKLDAKTQKEYAAVISNNIDLMDLNTIGKYSDVSDIELQKIASDLGLTVKQLAEKMGTTEEELASKLEGQAEASAELFKETEDQIKTLTKKEIPNAFKSASLGDLKSYAQLLNQAIMLGSEEALSNGFDAIFSSTQITEDQKEKIADIMDTFDWTTEGAGEEFISVLEQMGINIEEIIPNAEEFCDKLKLVNALYKKNDVKTVLDKVTSGLKEAAEVAGQDELTHDQYADYLEKGFIDAEDWVFNGKGWVNVTNGMSDLVEALKQNTLSNYNTSIEEAQAAVDVYEKYLPNIENKQYTTTRYGDWGAYNTETGEYDKNYRISGEDAINENYGDVPVGYTLIQIEDDREINVSKDALYAGTASEEEWQFYGFKNESEYKQWAQAASNYSSNKAIVDMSKQFDTSKVTFDSDFENSLDKFYNTYEKINALLRERERIERRYDKLLSNRATTAQDLINNSKEELNNLKEQESLQKYLQQGKAEEIQSLISKNSKYSKYVTGFDEETGIIQINWDEINKIEDSETGEAVSDYISTLEGLRDQWQDSQDVLEDIEDGVEDIYNQGKDEYFDLEDQIKDALIEQRQDEIDELTAINESITNTNADILDSIQDSIDTYREQRDNEDTEQEIEDKQRRLAYLQQDSSSATALDILNLQEEIEEAQEDYTDTLIDQKISELQEQNDEAAEQRQEQIDLLQDQLTSYEKTGKVWTDVQDLLRYGIDEKGIKIGSNLWSLLTSTGDYPKLSELGKLEWAKELNSSVNQAVQWLTQGNSVEGLLNTGTLKSGQSIDFTTADGKTLSGTVQADGTVVADGKTYSGIHRNYDGKYITEENYQGKYVAPVVNPAPKPEENNPYGKASETNGIFRDGASGQGVKSIQWALKKLGYDIGTFGPNGDGIDGKYGSVTIKAVKKFQQDMRNSGEFPNLAVDGKVGDETRKAFKAKKFETGGLADFTGPAWLDGTKSKPEYVLSADQTKAFFTLVDVLSGLKSTSTQSTQNNGEYHYDIDINVEKMDSDTDLEEIARKIEDMIVESSSYRNNNTL